MNLERLEELCLNLLSQSTQPVVSVDALLIHCRHDESLKSVSRKDLLDFLRKHHEVTVLEDMEAGEAALLQAAGVETGVRAALNARLPSRLEMTGIILQQIDQMQISLNGALSHAQATGDSSRAAQIQQALHRAEILREKVTKTS